MILLIILYYYIFTNEETNDVSINNDDNNQISTEEDNDIMDINSIINKNFDNLESYLKSNHHNNQQNIELLIPIPEIKFDEGI